MTSDGLGNYMVLFKVGLFCYYVLRVYFREASNPASIRNKQMFGLSLLEIVSKRAHVIFMLFVLVYE
jgi:hypothetical protein